MSDAPSHPASPFGRLDLDEARTAVATLRADLVERGEAGPLFGLERSEGLSAALGAIEQTFGGMPLYPSAQSRAVHLLYFVIKDHPFGDGNKRIGSLLFLEYLRRNGLLATRDGRSRLDDRTVVAVALLIAESDPQQKELMIRLVLQLLEADPA